MAYLKDLLEDVTYVCTKGNVDRKVLHICYDSREVQRGSMFICLSGTRHDGHSFIREAIQRGAGICVVSKSVYVEEDVTLIHVRNTREAMAYIARSFYGAPAQRMNMIGITGTKGKTTTAYMLYQMLTAAGLKTGLIGTLGIMYADVCIQSLNTTPDSLVLQRELRRMADAGCQYCVMEVSSQALKNCRVSGICFAMGIYTNLSEDHIGPGEHACFAEYRSCKKKLFAMSRIAVVNFDDAYAGYMTAGTNASVVSYGIKCRCQFEAQNIRYIKDIRGLAMTYELPGILQQTVRIGMPGMANAYNSLAALTAGYIIGIPAAIMCQVLESIQVKGRIEEVRTGRDFEVVIDYAHNAASLKILLETLRAYKPKRLVVVFGCGGNRSKLRRIQMGEAAGRMADFTVLTSDNPRYENPDAIIADIEQGMKRTDGAYHIIADRRKAITYAVEHAKQGDMLVIAGKGHEEYQEIQGQFYPMDERQMIESSL